MSRDKFIIDMSIVFLLVSIGLQCRDLFIKNDDYTVYYLEIII